MGCGSSTTLKKEYPAMIPLESVENLEDVARATLREINEDFELMSAVEISFSLTMSEPEDAMILFSADEAVLEEIGRTEVQKGREKISFLTTFRVTYSFEKQSKFRCDVYGMKNPNHQSLFRQNHIGFAKFAIHEIVCCPSKNLTKPIGKENTINIYAEELSKLKHKLKFVVGVECKRANGIYSIRVSRISQERNIPVYVTEGIERIPCGNYYLVWEPFSISMNRFCNGDSSKPALFELIRHDPVEKSLNSVEISIEELRVENELEKPFENGKLKGLFKILKFKYAKKPSFLDYVYGGCEISLVIGIDFSKSNGIQNSMKSYHNLNEDQPNDYIQAIKSVGEILQYYDTDKLIPVYGFGAKLPPSLNVVSHCFALNGDIFNPEVRGIQGVLECYQKTLNEVIFHGPTIFNEVISEIIHYASKKAIRQDKQRYFLILILTDGGVNDIRSTTSQIVKASKHPISIIIIGIGNEDFDNMNMLDADKTPLIDHKTGEMMVRDIVQFVPFNKYKNDLEALAREVLREIPDQVLEFMKSKRILPNIPTSKTTIGNFGSWAKKGSISSWAKKGSIGKSSIERGSSIVDLTDESIDFYEQDRQDFLDLLSRLGFNRNRIEYALRNGIACKSVELAIELINFDSSNKLRSVIKERKNQLASKRDTNMSILTSKRVTLEKSSKTENSLYK